MSDYVMQSDRIRKQADAIGFKISNWTRIVMNFAEFTGKKIVHFVEGIIGDDGWVAKVITILKWVWTLVVEAVKLATNYDGVFHMPVGDDMSAYEEAVELYKTNTINYDYIPAITTLVLLIVVWDYLYDIVVEKVFGALRHTVLAHRAYSFTAKVYPVLISLVLLPYIIYIYTYIYNPGEFNTLSLSFPPSHHLFPVCIMVNMISIFYLSFRYIRAGFDSASWRVSLCFMAAVFGCIFTWYENLKPPTPVKYYLPYKVLYKYFPTRVFVYIYMFDFAVIVYVCVASIIFAFKKYHQRFSNKKPPKDD